MQLYRNFRKRIKSQFQLPSFKGDITLEGWSDKILLRDRLILILYQQSSSEFGRMQLETPCIYVCLWLMFSSSKASNHRLITDCEDFYIWTKIQAKISFAYFNAFNYFYFHLLLFFNSRNISYDKTRFAKSAGIKYLSVSYSLEMNISFRGLFYSFFRNRDNHIFNSFYVELL